MENNEQEKRPFVLTTLLIVLSFLTLLISGLLVYIGVYFIEAQKGLEIYLADTFVAFPFIYIYLSLIAFSAVLFVSIVLMWLRKKSGLTLYFIWTFIVMALLLFAKQIDWFNIVVLLVFAVGLHLNRAYFYFSQDKKAETAA